MKHAVIFDIDGTLLRSAHEDDLLYRQAVESVLGTIRFRDALGDYRHVSDTGILNQLLSDNGLCPDPAAISEIKERFLYATRRYVSKYGPFREVPGAKGLVRRLQTSARHEVAIATGSWRHTARFKLVSAGFELDDVPLTSADDAINRVEIMQLALDSLGEGLGQVTYYGDGAWDEQACRELGWTFRPVGSALRGIESYEGEFVDI